MSDAIDAKPFPRAVLAGAAALIFATMVAAATARVTGVGSTHILAGPALETRTLSFKSQHDGSVRITSFETGALVGEFAPHQFGFIGVVHQGLTRERTLAGVNTDAPYQLVRRAGGRTEIFDPSTGRSLMLDAFGSGNQQAFNQIFALDRSSP